MIKKLENPVKFYKHCGFMIKSAPPNEDSGFMQYAMSLD
jgi:putative acetyltransferase